MSQWIASKLQSSMTKNMVFPSCSDIPLPFLMTVDHPNVAFVPPNFLDKGSTALCLPPPSHPCTSVYFHLSEPGCGFYCE